MSTSKSQSPPGNFAAKLEKLADDLDAGQNFAVTKLTPIKRLCADHAVALRFAGHFATLAHQKFLDQGIPAPATADQRKKIKAAVESGMESLKIFINKTSSEESTRSLSSAYADLKSSQDEYRKCSWGRVRSIYSREALIIETAIGCTLHPMDSPYLCYKIARDHAERYDPEFGTGLIPASADAVREISQFFRQKAQRTPK